MSDDVDRRRRIIVELASLDLHLLRCPLVAELRSERSEARLLVVEALQRVDELVLM